METYDYIVVGAGSSGCAVASRLSENPDHSVLLIEAGGPADDFWIRSPAGMGRLFLEKRFNWAYFTDPVPAAKARQIYWPRGRTLGGTSSVNGMVYMRGHPLDFDHWASLGNEGWSWRDVLPFFIKSESNSRGASEYHGDVGPLRVSDPSMRHPTIDDYLRSADTIGIHRVGDLNAPPYEGADFHQHTIRKGRRETSYTAFIEPIQHRKNLTVLIRTQIMRVVFDGNEATGVEVSQNGERRIIAAAREVILSAGSLNSPHLLMLSGIGDGGMLQQYGIGTRAHRPGVGQNLQDHWFGPMIWRTTVESSYNRTLSGWRKYLEGMRYLTTHRGLLSMSVSASAAFARSSDEQARPDLQMVLRPVSYTFDPKGAVVVDSFPGISAGIVLLNPKSRGSVALKSADPLTPPAFQPNYLSEPDDGRRTVIGLRRMREIMASEPIASRIVAEQMPGPGVQSDEELLDHIRTIGNCGWHQVGTCKMGGDDLAVVDARLRVHGVRRVRVADGSIMPTITSGNTNAPCIMIGEKAAAMIREDALPRRVIRS
ncbi:GMC family oxidoreductase [Paraburkholderia sp. D1E]|uniref:GMC family oxidoreductase n=1 Tax=Paraburkholderia sp. D1E TaxID=3461398 RepID=UPI0040454C6B